jgi:ketosteroid isomerase-like protein
MMRRSLCLVLFLLFLPGLVGAGQKKKPAQPVAPADPHAKQAESLVPLPDQQAIEMVVTEMLGAWQIGEFSIMKKYYADDVLVVSGLWEPPIIGWDRYVQAYLQQRKRMQSVQLNRLNTYIRVQGKVGWAVYQWNFTAEVEGQPAAYRGQTTLILEKRDGNWLIVTNHTSVADSTQQQAPPPQKPPSQKPAPQSPASKPGR